MQQMQKNRTILQYRTDSQKTNKQANEIDFLIDVSLRGGKEQGAERERGGRGCGEIA